MKLGPMAEVDCNALQVLQGITTTDHFFTAPPNTPIQTRALYANEDITFYVKDMNGNVTKKVMLAGSQVVGVYTNIWASETNGTITKVDADALTLIF